MTGRRGRARRKLSPEARQRIVDAQRKRWAEWKAKQKKTGEYNSSARRSAGGSRKKR